MTELDLISTGVLLLRGDARIERANAAAEHLLQRSRHLLEGAPLDSVVRNPERLRLLIERARRLHGSVTDQEVELQLDGLSHGGSRVVLSVTASPVEGEHGHEVACVLELRAVDQQTKMAREARLAEQSEATRVLVRNLAHEIKNPLGGLRGAAQLLERELTDPQLIEYTQVIIREADRLQALVSRLLTPHRLPRYGRQSLNPVIERVVALMRAEWGRSHAITADFDPSLPEVECDAEQIMQAVMNIARNACQATQGVEAPRVIVRTRVARGVVLARRLHRMAFEIAVIDNGPGVPPELRERIFYPLFTTRTDGAGSGLGLALAHTFVAQHGGTIELESEPGCTVFRILLPFSRPVGAGAEEPRV